MSKPLIFVTGGAGFVGSHCVLELLQLDYGVVVIDNLSNSVGSLTDPTELPESLSRVERLTNRHLVAFRRVDLLDPDGLEEIFKLHKFDAVIHFAALKAVGESVAKPLTYYANNVTGTVNLMAAMKKHGVKRLIFSSSCTVYGNPQYLPLTEDHPTGVNITNPYGRSKYMVEEMMKDLVATERDWCVILLRYFNPVGAHPSGDIGEDPLGTPNNLMPFVAQVAIGRRPCLKIFGSDFDTVDGTGVRDYVHIMDLASGHVQALRKMLDCDWTGIRPFNLGTGRGSSVLQVVTEFEKASGRKVPHELVARRSGDVAENYASASKAFEELGWRSKFTLFQMCEDAWRWQSKNPSGFKQGESE